VTAWPSRTRNLTTVGRIGSKSINYGLKTKGTYKNILRGKLFLETRILLMKYVHYKNCKYIMFNRYFFRFTMFIFVKHGERMSTGNFTGTKDFQNKSTCTASKSSTGIVLHELSNTGTNTKVLMHL
jgi:hypothetical protein